MNNRDNYLIMKLLRWLIGLNPENQSQSKLQSQSQSLPPDINKLKQNDDVWIGVGPAIYEGWVVTRKDNMVDIVYSDANNKLQDISFTIERPYNREKLEQDGCTLYINNPVIK